MKNKIYSLVLLVAFTVMVIACAPSTSGDMPATTGQTAGEILDMLSVPAN